MARRAVAVTNDISKTLTPHGPKTDIRNCRIKEPTSLLGCYDSSMHPELAKELQHAGFPNIQALQHRQGRQFLASDGRVSFYSLGELASTEDWFIPTLEELLAACEKKEGDNQLRVAHRQLGWFASMDAQGEQADSGPHQPTAEDAVARLWLALKKRRRA